MKQKCWDFFKKYYWTKFTFESRSLDWLTRFSRFLEGFTKSTVLNYWTSVFFGFSKELTWDDRYETSVLSVLSIWAYTICCWCVTRAKFAQQTVELSAEQCVQIVKTKGICTHSNTLTHTRKARVLSCAPSRDQIDSHIVGVCVCVLWTEHLYSFLNGSRRGVNLKTPTALQITLGSNEVLFPNYCWTLGTDTVSLTAVKIH